MFLRNPFNAWAIRLGYGLSWGSRHIPNLALQWKEKVQLAHKIGQFIGNNYLEIRYEDLVRDSEQTLHQICEFLEESYSPLMLDYHSTATREMPRVSLVWHKSSVSRVNHAKVFNWKSMMSSSDQVIYSDIAGKTLRQGDFVLSQYQSNIKRLCQHLIRGTIKNRNIPKFHNLTQIQRQQYTKISIAYKNRTNLPWTLRRLGYNLPDLSDNIYTLRKWNFSIQRMRFFVEGKAKNRRRSRSTARFFNAAIRNKSRAMSAEIRCAESI